MITDELLTLAFDRQWIKLEQVFHDDWSLQCPKIFAPNDAAPWDVRYDERAINENLLHNIAAVFCQDSNVGSDLSTLMSSYGSASGARRASNICGHVFRCGEPTYSCKECANDPTCVLCHDCFQKSAHKNHKYRMAASGGSGYCDCGDSEAWKQYPACEAHAVQTSADAQEPRDKDLPEDLLERLRAVSLILLRFCAKMTCWTEDPLPEIALKHELDPSMKPFQTVLLNDETHTYDSVIRALHLAIQCNEQQAMFLATAVDREGRATVRAGPADVCNKAKEEIQRRTAKESSRRSEKNMPLNVLVLDSRLVALQNFAIRLLSWLNAQIQLFPPLGHVIGEVLLTERLYEKEMEWEDGHFKDRKVILEHLLLRDSFHWKGARIIYHQMLMATVLMDIKQKQQFARLFVRCYPLIVSDFIFDDHEHAVSVTSLSVQIFTVPTIARMLIAEENALEILLNVFVHRCSSYLKDSGSTKVLNFATKPFPSDIRRSIYLLYDVGYLLTVVPSERDWNPALRNGFVKGFSSLIKLLSFMQGMDQVKRQSTEHQIWELEWETAFNIQIRLQSVITFMLSWACSNEEVHLRVMANILKNPEFAHIAEATKVAVEVNGSRAICFVFDVSTSKLSIHQPLWRLLAGLFTRPLPSSSEIDRILMEDAVLFQNNFEKFRAVFMEMPLRVLVLCAQSQAQMWRRNGFSLVNQIHNYSSPLCRTEMFDRDILMMQVCAALMPPDVFLIRLIYRFALHNWAQFGFEDLKTSVLPINNTPEELSKSIVTLAEEMFHLIIIIIGERYVPGVGKCSQQEMIEREVVHILATGPQPFSKIGRLMPQCPLIERLSLEEAVKTVGDFKKPIRTRAGEFSLKESYRHMYNPFFYHYSKVDVSQAEQHQVRERSNAQKSIRACPPPFPPDFEPFFEPIRNLLTSHVLCSIIRIVFERTSKRSRYSSDGLFHRALYLVGMGLNEQSNDNTFNFIAEAEKENLFELLEKLDGKPEVKENAELLTWVIQKYKTFGAIREGEVTAQSKEEPVHEDESKRAKKAAAMRMRQRAINQMNRMQQHFKAHMADLEKEGKMDEYGGTELRTDEDVEPIGSLPDDNGFSVCLGSDQSHIGPVASRHVKCILCQEVEEVKFNGKALVNVAYIQYSSLFAQRGSTIPSQLAARPLVFAGIPVGVHASTCGHSMHYTCYKEFVKTILDRERTRPRQPPMHNRRVVDPELGEYLCPLCKRLSNTAVPLLPPLSLPNVKRYSENSSQMGFDEWANTLSDLFHEPLQIQTLKPVKSHNRKRSHSERSLLELTEKTAEAPPDSGLSASVPSASSLSLLMDSDSTAESNTADAPSSVPELVPPGTSAVDNEQRGAPALDTRLLASVLPPIPISTVVHKIKEIIGHNKSLRDNVPPSLVNWEMIKSFLSVAASFMVDRNKVPVASALLETVTAWQITAFSLRSICAALRFENKPLFGAFNTRQREGVYCLSRICALAAFNCRPQELRLLLGDFLAPFLCTAPTSPTKPADSSQPALNKVTPTPTSNQTHDPQTVPHEVESPTQDSESSLRTAVSDSSSTDFASFYTKSVMAVQAPVNILCVDMLSTAIALAMCIGWTWVDGSMTLHNRNRNNQMLVIPDGSKDEQYAVRLALIGHIYQICASFDDTAEDNSSCSSISDSADTASLSVLAQLYATASGGKTLSHPSALLAKLRHGIVEFLRPIALFYHAITLIPPPEALKDPSVNEFEPLCRFLGFSPHLKDFLCGEIVHKFFVRWSAIQNIMPVQQIINQPVMANNLVQLPEDFAELVNKAADFRCPSIMSDEHASSVPTLCLVCGAVLCSQSYCCQRSLEKRTVGACSFHLENCAGPSGGLFFRIRDSQVILLASRSRGCFRPAPYVDEFGETDFGFRRGNPLHLNRELYAKLEHLWLHQGVTEEIVNQYEIDSGSVAFQWDHF